MAIESGKNALNPHELARTLQAQGERLKEQLSTVDTTVRDFVQERPLVAVGCAALCGYFIARLVSRW